MKMTASMKLPLTIPSTTPMPTINSTPPAINVISRLIFLSYSPVFDNKIDNSK